MSKNVSRKSAVVLTLSSILLSLLLAELVVRIVLPHPAYYRGHPGNVPGLVSEHPTRNYSWTAGFQGRMVTADFDTAYDISSQGLRDSVVSPGSSVRVLAIGDSFTAGEGVEADEAWPAQLQSVLSNTADGQVQRVVNAGVTGYSGKQMRHMVEELVPKLSPDIVVLGAFPEGANRVRNPFVLFNGHLVRSSQVSRMTAYEDGFLWYASDLYQPWAASIDIWLQRYFHLGAYMVKALQNLRAGDASATATGNTSKSIPDAAAYLEPLYQEIDAVRRFLENTDTQFVVLIVTGQSADGRFSAANLALVDALQEYCREQGIPVVNPVPELQQRAAGKPVFRFPNDAHWNPAGHRVAAGLLATKLQDEGISP